jgi:hypothetical protein
MRVNKKKIVSEGYVNLIDQISIDSFFTINIVAYLLANPKKRFKGDVDFFNRLPKGIYTAGGSHKPIIIKNELEFFSALLTRGILRMVYSKNQEKYWFQAGITSIYK